MTKGEFVVDPLAGCDIVTVVGFTTALIVVLSRMKSRATKEPTSDGRKSAVAEVTV
ncbi:MAG TPA: hypothetical protein VNC61_03070 [Acidimicrobiales bacterium]|nr:hypothetical protein [Acidimicrobiales bacterium]